MSKHDPVNNPKHYTAHPSGIQCIEITEHMGFSLGNAIKYIWRADLKADAIEDLKKARWYLDREIERREGVVAKPDAPADTAPVWTPYRIGDAVPKRGTRVLIKNRAGVVSAPIRAGELHWGFVPSWPDLEIVAYHVVTKNK